MPPSAEQHPFTPEPREPEGWPERDPTAWEWAGAEVVPGDLPGLEHTVVVSRAASGWYNRDAALRDRKRRIPIGFR